MFQLIFNRFPKGALYNQQWMHHYALMYVVTTYCDALSWIKANFSKINKFNPSGVAKTYIKVFKFNLPKTIF